ncbi:MFS transporter [Rugosimonospora africana]|uniref:MFS transporter n=1 Tax=Rugosimonospora africana TaxID=556532 RepID=A0A8J3QT00_9ACTN|nr:MFS transporter [Rugosimonospora africana]GIH15916.1 MFS transporter [Rugosimonospora africana]
MGRTSAVRARWAVTTVFGGNGLIIASLAVRTPSLKLDLGLSPGQLGLVTALFGIPAVLAMQTVGGLAARVGSAWIVRVAMLVLPIALVGVGLAPGLGSLVAIQLVFGAVHGTLDVTMNAHAVAVERELGRHIMNSCHAAWSIGSVTGALLGSAAAQLGMSRPVHYTILAAVLVPVGLLCGPALLPATVDRHAADSPASVDRHAADSPGAGTHARTGWRAGWTRKIVLFGAMGATVLTGEAAVANWSGVFLHDHLGASLGLAGLGYVAFTGCETAARLVGDRLLTRGSAACLLRVGTVTAAAGFAVVVASPWPALGIVGFAVVGLGLATPLPVLFGVVGHLGADGSGTRGAGAAAMVARFSTMTYSGILLAPAVIGWVTDLVGLTWTLAGLIPLLAAVAYGAGTATRPAVTERTATVPVDAPRPA